MITYKLTANPNEVLKSENGVTFTVPKGHREWTVYEDFLAKGKTPEPADAPIPPTYKEKREAEYPDSIADLVDELLTLVDAAGLIVQGSKLRTMQDARLVIKNKYENGL